LSIEEAAQRLNKSIRTIHRYKDAGRLTYVVGPSQGNPLYFSRVEVAALAQALYPRTNAPVGDPQLEERLGRVERTLEALLELQGLGQPPRPLDAKSVGALLVRLGNVLMQETEA
jgi:hypothetical protein